MNSKSLLVIVLMMLAPTVYGCVNFQATFVPNSGPGAYPLSAQLWDNRGPTDTPTCQIDDLASGDGLYHLNCFESDYSATFDASHFVGVAAYNRPGGSFQFEVPANGPGWAVCEYGCDGSQCFVPTY